MFWVSCLLCFGLLGNSLNGLVQYAYYASSGIKLPVLILVETLCVAASGFAMLISVISWRRRTVRQGVFWFVGSLLIYVLTPFFVW